MRALGTAASRRRSTIAGMSLVIAAGLAASGCSGGGSGASGTVSACTSRSAASATAPGRSASPASGSPSPADGSSNPAVAASWTLPGADLQNTRDVASAITSSNVSKLGVAWTVPLGITTEHSAGAYAATPVVVNGVVYTQDLESNVMAISLATGKLLWMHVYNSPNGGPDGVNVANGIVYAATNHAAVALQAATGRQLWSRTLIGNNHDGIDMAPGYDNGTVYVSTVPVNPTVGVYLGNAKAVLWALNARTGAAEWSWNEVQDLWGKPSINSGGGQWYPPSFDSQGNIYIGVANPGPLLGVAGYPWGTSRPGQNLYTDSVVKLSPRGRLLWYYQLTPHDLYDWDLQNSPLITTANGQQVVIDGGKAGILVELNAQTGKLIWKLPVGGHNGHDHDGLISEHAKPSGRIPLPASFCIEPGAFGGIETELATNGSTTFAAVNDLAMPVTSTGYGGDPAAELQAIVSAAGEMVAVNQDTGKIEWDVKLPSTPYGAATVTNNVVFTTTFKGYLYALNAATGAILLREPLSAGTNAPVIVDGDYVITGAGETLSPGQQWLIVAYKLGAGGKLPGTVGS